MPRKKKEKEEIRYYIPKGSKEKIDTIVDSSLFYKTKQVWKQKFYYLADYITAQIINTELDTAVDYVNINEEITAQILGVNNQDIATMLRDSITYNLFKKDGIVIKATKTRKGKKTHYLTEGKSCGYQFKEWKSLEELIMFESRSSYRKTSGKAKKLLIGYDKNLKLYHEVLQAIKLDETNAAKVILKALSATQKKKSQKEKYSSFIKRNRINNKPNKNNTTHTLPLVGTFVPVENESNLKAVLSYLSNYRGGTFAPGAVLEPVLLYHGDYQDGTFVPSDELAPIEINKEDIIDIVKRFRRSVFIINGGNVISSRPNRKSRVYNEITSLKREFREELLIDGKNIIGMDISNCQPLIAYIVIKEHLLDKLMANDGLEHGESDLPDDVKQYKLDCEAGMFYDYFMNELNIPEDLRKEFKADFFGKVFFSMHKIWENPLKKMFIKKYPNCWETICELKGGLNSKKFNKFSIMLQEKEAHIMFDTVNIELINQGIKAFNVFDSIYVNSMKDYETAKELTRAAFNAYGLHPTINPEYFENKTEKEDSIPSETKSQLAAIFIKDTNTKGEALVTDVKPKNTAKMKKKLIVDELLNSKSKSTKNEQQPTKLQHLKIQTEEEVKMNKAHELWLRLQDKDDIETQPKSEMTAKEIYDFVVAELKSNNHPATKENIHYLTNVFTEELKEDTQEVKPKEKYVFKNPYV